MRKNRDNYVYIRHIRDSAQKIQSYVDKHDFRTFSENDWDQDAVIRNLEIIGEASNNLDKDFKLDHPEVPWRTMINFRNVLAHEYADVDINIVWDIISDSIPQLLDQIEKLLEQIEPSVITQ